MSSVSDPIARHVPTLDQVVREHILHVVQLCGNHKTRAAAMLGIDRTTLWNKLRDYGVA
jgi:DNA-binding protein Fis